MKKKIGLTSMLTLLVALTIGAQMRVHLINVGQGCATLIEFPCAAILVDVGGEDNNIVNSSDSLKAYLDEFFARRVDLNNTLHCVYLTHPHADHTKGVGVILQAPFVIKNVVTDGLEPATEIDRQTRLHRAAQATDETSDPNDDIGLQAVTTDLIGAGGFSNGIIDPVNCSGTNPVIKVLWGTSKANKSWKANNHSMVVRIEYGTSTLLITGDLEEAGQRKLLTKFAGTTLLDADVYVAGHHGSSNGTLAEFLNKITPKMALIGVGDPGHHLPRTAWNYGHPNKGILQLLQQKITTTRSPVTILSGTGSMDFGTFTVSKAIYATAWDSHVVLEADAASHWQKIETTILPSLVNINTATLSELLTLPGIGETKANAIIQFRTAHGIFTRIDQLDDVPGIGPATISLVRPWVRL